jgi:hypothetical protein
MGKFERARSWLQLGDGMYLQLAFDVTPELKREQGPILRDEDWVDVSEIARGVGFTSVVQISSNLNETLTSSG